mmetsp:Transcript_90463/g.149896  ORF Transcript_90463/g.149896 Transcript_90463/m.149896 type:complete len:164 (-) Transcript_90463:71-562(-)
MLDGRRRSGGGIGAGGYLPRSSGDPGSIDTGGTGSKNVRNMMASVFGERSSSSGRLRVPWMSSTSAAGSSQMPSQNHELPSWISTGSHLSYQSKSSGKVLEVIVEMVSDSKKEVEITFADHPGTWKIVPFSVISSPNNPLLGPWKPKRTEVVERQRSRSRNRT